MSKIKAGNTSIIEMLSFGGGQFATAIYIAFSSYYLMMFCTDVAMISAKTTAALLFCVSLFGMVNDQIVGLSINRARFADGKYRPYYKLCTLPLAIGLIALSLTPEINASYKIIYAAFVMLLCEVCRSVLCTAAVSMIPYLAQDDVSRTKFVSFFNGGAILAFIVVGTFMLPLADFFGGNDRSTGFVYVLALFAFFALMLHFNAYFNLKERHYVDTPNKPAIKDMFLCIGQNKKIMLFLTGYCLYNMADAFKNMTAYYYVTYNMGRPDLLPAIILSGLISTLAIQPMIPRLLVYVKKETLVIAGLFATSCSSLLMLAAGNRPFALVACVMLYGLFTAIVANLVFAMMASFSDEIRLGKNMSMSEILVACMSLSSNLGSAIASGIAPLAMAAFGYAALAAAQPPSALLGIKVLYVLCTATGMALSGAVFLLKQCGEWRVEIKPKDKLQMTNYNVQIKDRDKDKRTKEL